MKRTRLFVTVWVSCFLLLLCVGLGYQYVAVTNDIPNDAISHLVEVWSEENPLTPLLFAVAVIVLFAGSLFCACHWWVPNFRWWPKARFVEDEDPSND